MSRYVYGAILGALGVLVLLRLSGGNSMLELVGVLLVLAALAVVFVHHKDDEDVSGHVIEETPVLPHDDENP